MATSALIGLAVAAVLAVPLLLDPGALVSLQLRAADAIFLNAQGPHLGYRPPSGDIVRVVEDAKTANEIGTPTIADDIALYRQLLREGAKVVADPRPISDPATAVQLLDGLEATPGAAGHVFLNIHLPLGSPVTLTAAQEKDYVGGDVIYSDASLDVNRTVRYYPLLWVNAQGYTDETLALKVARVALGDPLAANPVLLARNAGVLGLWVKLDYPSGNAPPVLKAAEAAPPAPYVLDAAHALPWVYHPSHVSPALISPAALWINYRAAPGDYPHSYSYVDVLKGRIPAKDLSGKVVFVDATGALFAVPTSTSQDETWAGVDIQVVEQILSNSYIAPTPSAVDVVILVVLDLLIATGAARLSAVKGGLVVVAALLAYAGLAYVGYRAGWFPDLVIIPASLVVTPSLLGGQRFVRETRERRRILDLFGRYVSRSVATELINRPTERALALGGSRREITVLFADIRGFTALAAGLNAERVIIRLNELFGVLVGAAFAEAGTVDKYIGDALLVIWNAPLDQPDHPLRAVRAALAMVDRVRNTQLGVGIGIHCGEAVVGNVGTRERLEYTAIGATVNLASRLCDSAASGEIVISDELRLKLGSAVHVLPRPPFQAKGLARAVSSYRVTALA